MRTEIIRVSSAKPDFRLIKKAATALEKGRLVVFPTETVYGIGVDANNKKALSRLRRLKERQNKPFSFHISSKSGLKRLNCVVDNTAKKIIKKFWPGPLTLVFNAKNGGKLGVRMPSHPVALGLLKKTKALVVAPSANFKAKKPAVCFKQALSDLNGMVDMIIDSGRTGIGVSSTVLDLTQTPPKILRKGAVSKKAIEKIIGRVAG